MKGIKIKETYLLFLIVIGLVTLALYSTYALFTTSTEIENVVDFAANLTVDSGIIEYETVTVSAGESKIVEVNVNNTSGQQLYYGTWYEMVSPSEKNNDIEVGIFLEKDDTPSSGTVASNTTISLLVGITNNTSSEIIINIGTVGSITNNLGLSDTRSLITDEWADAIVVTDEVLAEHTSTKTETTTTTNDVNLTYSYKGSAEAVTLNPGTYKLEVWGAQGGSYNTSSYTGGKGGYSYGTLTLTEQTNLFVNVGGQGTGGTSSGSKTGGYNGGGSAYTSSTTYLVGSGGGASDIRIDTNKDGTGTLYERVIVAGGGGGFGSYNTSSRYAGGAGGGTSGGTGSQYSTSYRAGTGGSATTYGTSYYGSTSNSTTYGNIAAFGTGGGTKNTSYSGISGGGGGWYGGGYGRRSPGGGGSGYVYTSSTASNCPSGCLLTSKYYLTNASTSSGSQSGNGSAKITGTEQVTTQVERTIYSIPRVLGLTNLSVKLGNSVDLNSGVTIECAEGETGCSIVTIPNIDTTSLTEGTYTVYYVIKDSQNNKYKYPRTINVSEAGSSSKSLEVLTNLGLSDLLKEGTPDFSATATTDEGIYAMEDDLGMSYYFRGASENNYVKFGKNSSNQDMYWRIIRINGDGTIRMIYDGTTARQNGTTSTNGSVATIAYNSINSDNTYLGYMTGQVGANTYSLTHSNSTNSTVKEYLENTWYASTFKNTSYEQYIADGIFCNDRSLAPDTTGNGTGTVVTDYFVSSKINTNGYTATLYCNNKEDRFTLTNSTIETTDGKGTNKKLNAPVGLITANEVSMAGGIISTTNNKFYLYNGNNYWTMTPMHYDSYSYIYCLFSGRLLGHSVANSTGRVVIPVINLKSDVLKYDASSSNGTMTYPFVLK